MDLFTFRESYPDAPGFKDRTTSRDAAASMASSVSRLRGMCLQALRDIGSSTPDEIAAELGLSVLSVRPRITELAKMGRIIPTGETRPNASGRSAKVYRLT